MHTTRLASIGNRVEIATLILVKTVTSRNPSTSPGMTCITWAHCLPSFGASPADSRKSYAYLYQTPAAKSVPEQ